MIPAAKEDLPTIPEHELLARIGAGGYGEVWLARNPLGGWRAIKIVRRERFSDPHPYEREWSGIRRYEPVSRGHPGLVDLLQCGRNEAQGFFYYVMELADPVGGRSSGEGEVGRSGFRPQTLTEAVRGRKRLPVVECARIGETLADALAFLHRQGLVHRDVKPSNVIFAGGIPKLADIGLVSGVDEARSFVGTEGFVPPEGPGTPQADLYALGKLLYVVGTGAAAGDFPSVPPAVADAPDRVVFAEFNAVLLKACAPDPRERYQSADELARDLARLRAGQSVRRRFRRRRWWRAARVGGGFGVGILLAVLSFQFVPVPVAGLLVVLVALLAVLGARPRFPPIRPSPSDLEGRRRAEPAFLTLAVLPFSCPRSALADAPPGDELAVDLAGKLARLPGLKVLARHSTRALGEGPNSVVAAARQGIDLLLSGELHRAEGGWHLTLELSNVRDGCLRWSHTYAGELADLPGIQSHATLQIAAALGQTVTETLSERLAHPVARNPRAYEQYLAARRHLHRRTPADFLRAVALFEEALREDPDYAPAYAGLAQAYVYLGYGFGSLRGVEVAVRARSAAKRALELEPTLVETHLAQAIVHWFVDREGGRAEAEFLQALQLDPQDPSTRHFHAVFLLTGPRKNDLALAEARHALDLDPLSLPLNNFVGIVLFFVGRFEEAIRHQLAWLKAVPQPADSRHELSLAYFVLGRCHEVRGHWAEAVHAYLEQLTWQGVPDSAREALQNAYRAGGWLAFLRALVEGMEALWQEGGQTWMVAYEIALGRARLGDTDRALAWLEQLADVGCTILIWLEVEPLLQGLHGTPRFESLVRRCAAAGMIASVPPESGPAPPPGARAECGSPLDSGRT